MGAKFINAVVASVALCIALPANASTTAYTDISIWKATVGSYVETTNFGVPDYTFISQFELDDGGPTLTLANPNGATAVSIGDGYSTWCCGYSGQVLRYYPTNYSPLTDTATGNFSTALNAFGIYIEPVDFLFYNVTFALSDGTTVTQAVNGNHGATFFGFVSTTGITSYTFTLTADPPSSVVTDYNGFAIGDAFLGVATPLPTALPLFASGLGALGALGWRKRRKAAA